MFMNKHKRISVFSLIILVLVFSLAFSDKIVLADDDHDDENTAKNFTVQDVNPVAPPTEAPSPGKDYDFIKNGDISDSHLVNQPFNIYIFLANNGQSHQEWITDKDTPVKVTLNGPGFNKTYNVTIPKSNTYTTLNINCPTAGTWSISLSGTLNGDTVRPNPWYFTIKSNNNGGGDSAENFTIQDVDPGTPSTTAPNSGTEYHFISKGDISDSHKVNLPFNIYIFLTNEDQTHPEWITNKDTPVNVTLNGPGFNKTYQLNIKDVNTYNTLNINCPTAGMWSVTVNGTIDGDSIQPAPWYFSVQADNNNGEESAKNFTVQDVYPDTPPTTEPNSTNYNFINKGNISNAHHVNQPFNIYIFLTNNGQAHQEWIPDKDTTVNISLNGPGFSKTYPSVVIPKGQTYVPLEINCPTSGVWSVSVSGTINGDLIQPAPWFFAVDSSWDIDLILIPGCTQIPVGGTYQFHAYLVTNFGGNVQESDWTWLVWWDSDNDQIANVGSLFSPPWTPGLVTGNSEGMTTITASIPIIGPSGSANVIVGNPTSLQVNPPSAPVILNQTSQLSAQLVFPDNVTSDVTSLVSWVSSAPDIAQVGTNGNGTPGLVSGQALGTATITASVCGFSGSSDITVISPLPPILTITPLTKSKNIDESFIFTAMYDDRVHYPEDVTSKASWSSSNTEAAPILKGLVTPGIKSASGVIITATYNDANNVTTTAQATINVIAPELTLQPSTPQTINVNGSLQYSALYSDAYVNFQDVTSSLTWSSTNTNVATVNTGNVSGVSAGTTQISCTYGKYSASTTLTVVQPTLTILADKTRINKGETLQLTPYYSDANVTNQVVSSGVSWTTDNTSVATVNNSGLLNGVSAGTVTVTATYQGLNAQIIITVVQPSITITGSNSIPIGGTSQLAATYTDAYVTEQNITNTTWSSSNSAIASVNSSGLVTGKLAGTVNITATYNGISGSFPLTVQPPEIPPSMPSGWKPDWRHEVVEQP